MRIGKIVGIILLIYVVIVVIFESLLGYYQPSPDGTIVITTTNSDGVKADRVLANFSVEGTLYVAANHWPRAWFHQAQENPNVRVKIGEQTNNYIAADVSTTEHALVESKHPLPLTFRILTGFPPRYFLRLDPAS